MKRSNISVTSYFFRFVGPTLAVIFFLAMTVQSQVLYGALIGRVEDQTGARVAGARISVTNKATGQERDVVTDAEGAYAFRDLQVGVYDIKITQTGFKAYLKSGVSIAL